jgi:hypothetical protein
MFLFGYKEKFNVISNKERVISLKSNFESKWLNGLFPICIIKWFKNYKYFLRNISFSELKASF